MTAHSRTLALLFSGLIFSAAGYASSYQASYFSGSGGLYLIDCAGMNDAGEITGWGSVNGGSPVSFLRTNDGNYTTFRVASDFTFASAVNDLGQVVGGYQDATGTHGFVRAANGGVTTLQIPYAAFGLKAPVTETVRATGINDNGQVVGTFSALRSDGTTVNESFLMLANGTFEQIEVTNNTYVTSISNNGYILGYSSGYDFVLNSSLRTIKEITNVPSAMGSGEASLTSINDNGDIVGSFDSSNHAFITNISSSQFTSLPSPQNCSVGSINDAGTITGTCGLLDQGFLLTPTPEPATGLLLLFGFTIAGVIRGRGMRCHSAGCV